MGLVELECAGTPSACRLSGSKTSIILYFELGNLYMPLLNNRSLYPKKLHLLHINFSTVLLQTQGFLYTVFMLIEHKLKK